MAARCFASCLLPFANSPLSFLSCQLTAAPLSLPSSLPASRRVNPPCLHSIIAAAARTMLPRASWSVAQAQEWLVLYQLITLLTVNVAAEAAPPIRAQVLCLLRDAARFPFLRPHRVQVHVSAQLPQIVVSLYQLGPVSALHKVSGPVVLQIEMRLFF